NSEYNRVSFSDGSTLRTVNQHRMFNKEAGKFTYAATDDSPLGATAFNHHGEEITVVGKERVVEHIDHYNIITDGHMNLFADSILTSCRFNNLYPIADMKFVKDNRSLHRRSVFAYIPDRYYHGLRLSEQQVNVSEVTWYVSRLIENDISS